MEEYDKIIELAVSMAKVTTREQVKEVTWAPFTLLYEAMIRRKEIEPLSSLPPDKKWEYWEATEGIEKRYKRIFICQALYVFDLITG